MRSALVLTLGAAGFLAMAGVGRGQALDAITGYSEKEAKGRELAKIYCSVCHIQPQPNLINREAWQTRTLPWMRTVVGLDTKAIEFNEEAELLKQSGAFMPAPLMTEEEFKLIAYYYLAAAPVDMPPSYKRPEITAGLKGFKVRAPHYRTPNPMALMVQIQEKSGEVYVGDGHGQKLDILDPMGNLKRSLPVGNLPTSAVEFDHGIYVTSIGHFFPMENPIGSLTYFKRTAEGFEGPQVILDKLPRPVDTKFVDINQDGRLDMVMCMFGNYAGRFSWFENLGEEKYEEHILYPKPGAISSVVEDFNGDGLPDVAVLMTQNTEAVFIMYNDGDGEFTTQMAFQHPPSYGHSYFEMVDFNQDGLLDIIATNGDNGEYTTPPKRYHGIRIYLNQGEDVFEEKYFYPMHGAFKAMAHDYDGDGDLDLAAISYFPDYEKSPQESFVYLENHGNFKFTTSSFRECLAGRWLTMDTGDLDGDGDQDIVLGAVMHGPRQVPPVLAQEWAKSGLTYLVLENTHGTGPSPASSTHPDPEPSKKK